MRCPGPAAAAAVTRDPPSAAVAAATPTLLLVEDHEQVRTLVHLILERLGYTVLGAALSAPA
jgi:hypothetical protein